MRYFGVYILLAAGVLPVLAAGYAIRNKDALWPNNTIPYKFYGRETFTAKQKDVVRESMQTISRLTGNCVQFVEHTTEDDYVVFKKSLWCSSMVGRQRGEQDVSLSTVCLTSHREPLRQLLHALGFYNEHTRSDRDEFITINWDNIRDDLRNVFAIVPDGDTLGLPYDYRSILHYPVHAFATDPRILTIVPKFPKVTDVGTHDELSALDVMMIERLYGCPTAEEKAPVSTWDELVNVA
ncbi:zinc metalloproteinase nas-6-like [Paramacrobiotus metropolitanus]|uniref:zinc metalloproteinase nas-6-like n=1 Tax=Paramacrobiotus metropolitanus TaxID=2943436 RepID=UPI002445E9F3|nr:zinc metalloproteinase nas-6-like [Paramacrobiotus metropolitanus]